MKNFSWNFYIKSMKEEKITALEIKLELLNFAKEISGRFQNEQVLTRAAPALGKAYLS